MNELNQELYVRFNERNAVPNHTPRSALDNVDGVDLFGLSIVHS